MKLLLIVLLIFAAIGFVFTGSVIIVLVNIMAENNRDYDPLNDLDLNKKLAAKTDESIRLN